MEQRSLMTVSDFKIFDQTYLISYSKHLNLLSMTFHQYLICPKAGSKQCVLSREKATP